MLSSLIDQYVVGGWHPNTLYFKIVAVIQDREKVFVFAKSLDNRIITYDLETCAIVRETPHQKVSNVAHVAFVEERDKSKKDGLLELYEACVKRANETMSE